MFFPSTLPYFLAAKTRKIRKSYGPRGGLFKPDCQVVEQPASHSFSDGWLKVER